MTNIGFHRKIIDPEQFFLLDEIHKTSFEEILEQGVEYGYVLFHGLQHKRICQVRQYHDFRRS